MRAAKIVFAFCAFGLLAGCTDYYDHNEAMTPYSGEAIAANRVAQMVDPWPAKSASAKIGANGERMQRAITNYKAGAAASSSSSSGSSGSGNGEQSNNGSASSGSSSSQD